MKTIKWWLAVAGVVGLLWGGEGWGQDSLGIRRIATVGDYWGDIRGATVANNRVFLETGCGISVLSLEQGNNLQSLGHRLTGWGNYCTDGNYLYGCIDSVFIVLSSESTPSVVAVVPLAFHAYSVIRYEHNVFILSSDSLVVFDVARPESPVEVSSISSYWCSWLTVSSDLLVAKSNQDSIHLYDISDPAHPSERHSLRMSCQTILDAAFVGDILLVLCDTPKIVPISLADPDHPQLLDLWECPATTNIKTLGATTYLWDPRGILITLNTDNPAAPEIVTHDTVFTDLLRIPALHSTIDGILALSPDSTQLIACISDLFYCATTAILWDISDPNAPWLSTWRVNPGLAYLTAFTPHHVALIELGMSISRLGRVDVRPSILMTEWDNRAIEGRLRYEDGWNDPAWFPNAVARDNYLFFSPNDGINIIDVHDPASPRIVAGLDHGCVAILHDSLTITFGNGDMTIYDARDLNHIRELSNFVFHDERETSSACLFGDTLLYAIDGSIKILNIADPATPTLVGGYERFRWQTQMAVAYRNYLYVSSYSYEDNITHSGVNILDCSDPLAPNEVNYLEMANDRWCNLDTSGHYLIVGGEKPNSLGVFDLADPVHPRLTGYYRSNLGGFLSCSGSRVVMAEGAYFGFYDCSAAMGENVAPVWHNPPDSVSINEGQLLRLTLHAVDLNGDSLTLSALDLPRGAHFTDNGGGQGTLVWQTNINSAGNYSPRFVASDGQLTDTCAVSIVIINVDRPVHLLSPPDGSIFDDPGQPWEGDSLRFSWTRATNPDSNVVQYHLKLVAVPIPNGGGEFPHDSLTFDARQDTSCLVGSLDILSLMQPSSLRWCVWVIEGHDSVRSVEEFSYHYRDAVSDSTLTPYTFHLSPIYPNPFNSSTAISFSLPSSSTSSSLRVYDLSGRLIADLTPNGRLAAGEHRVVWNAGSLPDGIYFAILKQASATTTRKMVLMK